MDLRTHSGVHPRFGVVDVVPFVALDPDRRAQACALRDATAEWLATNFALPVFLYGPLPDGTSRSLPEVRRLAFSALAPDFGPDVAPARLGAVAVGCRPVLIAWNVWLRGVTLDEARAIAAALRRPAVRALGLRVGDDVQVSCNLLDADHVRASQIYDQIASMLPPPGSIVRAELVGLAPEAFVAAERPDRLEQLGLSHSTTIESRVAP